MISIKNDYLCVTIDKKGAQMNSILSLMDNYEYLWQRNPDFWSSSATVLFPIVGKLIDNKYTLNGETYEMNQHGLARGQIFEVLEKQEYSVVMSLNYNEETLAIYPYKFELQVKFSLDKNKLNVNYTVINKDEGDIYFSIGAHPGFNIPFNGIGNYEDYYVEFEKEENLEVLKLTKEGYIDPNFEKQENVTKIINLKNDLFKNDALIFKNLSSEKVWIKNKLNNKSIKFSFKKFPYLALWSKPNAPFLCLEPWFGHSDFNGFNGDFKDKDGIIALQKGSEFSCTHSITIHW